MKKISVLATALNAVRFFAALTGMTMVCAAAAQSRYPEKLVRVIGGNAGGLPDTVARMVVPKLAEAWGQPVIMENRPSSAGTMIAAEAVAKAAPDGYTLLVSDAQRTSATMPIGLMQRLAHWKVISEGNLGR